MLDLIFLVWPYFLTHGVSHRSLVHLHIQGNLGTVLIRPGGEKPVLAIKMIIQIVNSELGRPLPPTLPAHHSLALVQQS